MTEEPGFRQALLTDPQTTLAEVLGHKLPEGLNVTVHEESLTDIHIVIPAQIRMGELTEGELTLVGGGVYAYTFPLKRP
jgi:hypothetical protein